MRKSETEIEDEIRRIESARKVLYFERTMVAEMDAQLRVLRGQASPAGEWAEYAVNQAERWLRGQRIELAEHWERWAVIWNEIKAGQRK